MTIPNSVTTIGYCAFGYCTGLTSITIPNSVSTIESCAFIHCIGLISITIGNSVTSIGDDAFGYCTGLTSVYITDLSAWCKIDFEDELSNPLYYSAKLILNGYGITSLVIPNDITEIKDYAFFRCTGLTSVTIPNSVTSIGVNAFSSCYGLTSVTIPNSVTSIETSAFYNCDNLTSIKVETENSVYDSRNNCNAIIKTSTNTLILGCKNSTIPNSVTTIGSNAFYDCDGLTSVTIPNSVTTIGSYAFSGCSYIRTIYCQSATPPSYPSSFADDILMYSTLYVPTGCKSAYEAVDPWRNFWNIEEMEFNGIEDIVADGDEISVIVQDGEIVVNGIENAMVEVYNINGQLVYSGSDTTIAVVDRGIYIVKVANKTFKVAL